MPNSNRRLCVVSGFVLALAVASFGAPAHAGTQKRRVADEILIGCNWPSSPPPEVEELLFEAGMNYARLTGGGYGWATGQHKAAADRLAAHDVKVILQLGSHYPSADYFKFKSAQFIDEKGQGGVEDRNSWAITYSGQAWPQYSYAATELRPAFERDFGEYLNAFKSCKNVAGVILHNEPGLFWNDKRLFDYNPKTIALFRNWLRCNYTDIGELNNLWGSSWASFDEVDPPRKFPPVESTAAWIDWRRTQALVVRIFLQWEVAFARRAWPGLPTTTNLPGPLDAWHLLRATDNYFFSEGFDFAGIDIYVDDWTPASMTSYALDMTRGIAGEREYQVLECDVFDPNKFKRCSDDQRAGLMRSFLWTQIGHGARGILLWWGGGGHFELVSGGAYNERLAAVREVTHLVQMLNAGAYTVPKRSIAVVVDPDSVLYYGASSEQRPYWLEKNARGWHKSILDAGVEADVLFSEQVRAGGLKGYRGAVLSAQVLADKRLATALTEFVSSGGVLVAESAFAEADRRGTALAEKPGFGLARVFGLTITSTEVGKSSRISWGGGAMQGDGFLSKVSLGTARAVSPGLTVNAYGRGRAIFIAARVGAAYADGNDSGLSRFVTEYLAPCVPAADVLTVTHAGDSFVDAMLLADKMDNALVVVTVPPNGTKTPVAVADVVASLPAERLRGVRGAYVFEPVRVKDGWTSSLPRELPVSTRRKAMPLELGTIDSAAVVLLARDAGPLLGMRTPASAKAGSTFEVTVTCHNASGRRLVGRVLLDPTRGCMSDPIGVRVSIDPWEKAEATFTVKAGTRAGRAIFTPALDADTPVEGIPHDVYITPEE